MLHHFSKIINSSVSKFSLRDKLFDLIKNVSKIFHFLMYSGALVSASNSDLSSGNYFNCLAGSDCLFGSSCSVHYKAAFLTDSPL